MSDSTGAPGKPETGRYLSFTLCGEEYAIPLLHVKEVIGYTEPTPIPQAPSHFKGVINLRGQVISIVDLRLKLKLGKSEVGPESSIVILDLSPYCLGVVVDSVDCVMALNSSEIERSNDVENFVKGNHLLGIAKKDKKLILLLDIKATLEVADIKTIRDEANKAA